MNVRNCFHFKTFLLFCKKNKSRCCVLGGKAFSFGSCHVYDHVPFKSKKGEVASSHMSSGYLVHKELK